MTTPSSARTRRSASPPGVLANDDDLDGTRRPRSRSRTRATAVTLNSDGSFTYQPDENYVGPDSFTYKVSDGTVDSTRRR